MYTPASRGASKTLALLPDSSTRFSFACRMRAMTSGEREKCVGKNGTSTGDSVPWRGCGKSGQSVPRHSWVGGAQFWTDSLASSTPFFFFLLTVSLSSLLTGAPQRLRRADLPGTVMTAFLSVMCYLPRTARNSIDCTAMAVGLTVAKLFVSF